MATVVHQDLLICADCALWFANGDDSGAARTGDETVAAYEREWDGWRDVTTGNYPLVAVGHHTESFHTAPCDTCGDDLAGDRFHADLMD